MPMTAAPAVDLEAVATVVAALHAAALGRFGLDELRAEAARITAERPGVRVHLVHEHEQVGPVHTDALVRQRDGTTISVGVAAGDLLPWPLRGAVRASERDLVIVNGVTVTIEAAMTAIDFMFDQPRLLTHIVDGVLIAQALADDPIELSEDDIQAAADAFRRAKGLLTAQDTHAWLAERSLTAEGFEDLVADQARIDALRRRVTDAELGAWRRAHEHEMDVVLALVVGAGSQEGARSLADELRADRGDPLAMLIMARRDGHPARLVESRVGDLPGGLAGLIGAEPGQVVVGVTLDENPAAARVLDVRRVEFEPDHARRRIFDQWLADRRAAAQVRWCWGNAGRTGRAR
jgi:putative peptide maturation system protein